MNEVKLGDDTRFYSGIVRDITDRKKSDEAIKKYVRDLDEREARLQAILDNTVDGIITIDETGTEAGAATGTKAPATSSVASRTAVRKRGSSINPAARRGD